MRVGGHSNETDAVFSNLPPLWPWIAKLQIREVWVGRDNLTQWTVLQFGGMALAVGLALTLPRSGALVCD